MKKIYDNYVGTCHSPDVADLTMDELKYLDELMFCCEYCGWWYDVQDCYSDNVCVDCYDEEE